jgi:hypothetical protein
MEDTMDYQTIKAVAKEVDDLTPEYMAGFIDGEGCFELGVNRTDKAKLRYGWRPRIRFSIAQIYRPILVLVQKFFGVGTLRLYVREHRANCYYFALEHRRQILEVTLPIFDTIPLIVKRDTYELWREAVILLGPGKTWHPPETYHRYLDLREKINPGRGRRRKVSVEVLREAVLLREAKQ